jgi:hypothetical protein
MSDINSLKAIMTEVWATLGRAAVDKQSPLRWFTLATVSPDGQPEARTVVLRGVDRGLRRLTFYSDRRAAKVPALTANPTVSCHFFDAKRMVQYRLDGQAEILTEGTRWNEHFQRLSEAAIEDYAALLPPGSIGSSKRDTALAANHFTVIDVAVDSLDWLRLSRDGHLRARFDWQESKTFAEFIVP